MLLTVYVSTHFISRVATNWQQALIPYVRLPDGILITSLGTNMLRSCKHTTTSPSLSSRSFSCRR
jgi:hypothetical protein